MKKSNIQMAFLIGEAILLLTILILEILPYGVTLTFDNMMPDESIIPSYVDFSYFSLVPYGYGNVPPFFTAILSTISLPLFAIGYFVKNKWTMYTVIILQTLVFVLSIIQVSCRFFQPITIIGILILVFRLYSLSQLLSKKDFSIISPALLSLNNRSIF